MGAGRGRPAPVRLAVVRAGGDTGAMEDSLQAGATLGSYRIDEVLAFGGMGTVYRATQEPLGRTVALKVIASNLARDPDFRLRFRREARLAASIDHPNLVAVFEAGEEDEIPFMAMQYVEGTDLSRALAAESWLEPSRAIRLIEQVGAALDRAHAGGLVHRDVKPANVLLGEVGGEEWAYLTDFGLTKAAVSASELTGSGQWVGTLDYASPEQIQDGRVDARSDVYSLGCVLFELLTGRIPFERDDEVAKLWAHVNAPPPSPSETVEGVPPEMDEVVGRAMAKRPQERHPSAGDLARAARAALEGTEVEHPERSVAKGPAAGDGARTRVMLRQRARPPVLMGAALGALILAALVAILLLPEDDGPSVTETIQVGNNPVSVSYGEGSLWVTDEGGGSLIAIDPGTSRVRRALEVGGSPRGVAVGEGSVWVADSSRELVTRIDPLGDPPTVAGRIRVGAEPSGIAVGQGLVWVTNLTGDSVSRIRPGDGQQIGKPIPVGTAPAGIAVGSGSARSTWVALSGGGRVVQLSPSGDLVNRVEVGDKPRGIAVGEDGVWVSNSLPGTVSRIDQLTGEVVGDPTRVGARPAGIAVGEGYVWVANTDDGTVSRLDPESGERVGDDIEVGQRPRGIAIGAGSVWVANSGDGTVSRIDP
jgi:YVTN family beta-propeller protein